MNAQCLSNNLQFKSCFIAIAVIVVFFPVCQQHRNQVLHSGGTFSRREASQIWDAKVWSGNSVSYKELCPVFKVQRWAYIQTLFVLASIQSGFQSVALGCPGRLSGSLLLYMSTRKLCAACASPSLWNSVPVNVCTVLSNLNEFSKFWLSHWSLSDLHF